MRLAQLNRCALRAFFGVASLAFATAASPPLARTIVLQHFTLIDGTGAPPASDQSLIIVDGRISWVGPSKKLKVPTGATPQNLRGKFVMPGIIDSHVHLGLVDGIDQNFPKYYNRQNVERQLRLYAAYGVTSVYTLGTDGDEIHDVIADQHRNGPGDEARVYTAGRGVVFKGSYGGVVGLEQSVATPAEAAEMVAREASKGDDFIKLWMDDEFGSLSERMPYSISASVIDAAHKAGKKTAAHIFYYDNAAELTREGVDAFMHQVRDRRADPTLAQSMKARGTWQLASTLSREASFTYQLLPFVDDPFFYRGVAPETIAALKAPERQKRLATAPNFPKYPEALRNAMANLATEARNGVSYGMGTDSGPSARFPGYFAHWELELMVQAGLTPLQAITAATGTNAKFLPANEAGTIVKGKWADLLVLDRNPLADIRNTRMINTVFVAGRKVSTIWQTCVGRPAGACSGPAK